VDQIRKWEKGMLAYLEAKASDVLGEMRTKKAMNDDLNARLKGAIEKFKPTFIAG
jgi:F-type H+-transporting ATPase subunit alpha